MHQEWQGLGDVSETLLLPLYARILESRSRHPVFKDPEAERIADQLFPFFESSSRPLYRRLAQGKLHPLLVRTLSLRTLHFDQIAQTWLQKHPQGTIISLGCGLDTRFSRIDNGQATWIELDLPEVIRLRQNFFEAHPRIQQISESVLNLDWFSQIPSGPRLFLAEGLFMYLPETELRLLLQSLVIQFAGSELLCEMASRYWVENWGWIISYKMQREFHLREKATFYCGIHSGKELESWAPGLKVLNEWSYFDEKEGLPLLYHLRHLHLISRIMWSLHCRLGDTTQ
ncbi:hypothetical protein COW36_14270 [bacterium (Candidatus Blackallbacteria) CG17_big_fil_post_rev_8_21_14_2_50_48_46]|uniref:Methyltransferase n=1 Tax=bacterium (Candidatus Blackallbacteria) CG17_big_fil_post_rev_8_21_14_2_50_48_46 TaxID=2014261 RepID=A0A2M7G2T0_9BACT|nr:MAG: hypothetical protein COW64_08795 [bacterium (Candidatus Blackallbacteria) CG18_big_fil_WC_8_21_14_2_50_49_26]PIW16126.1 MAG: hypothetical protein COW36_14270 [bacterium (Candidatus Blackallbacteria) CG17_big_fil_post_rev_8_21_14_2_50_48_46]PIW45775.1 MAG: hypothetical protein COW20_18980 [bacterium (Candidatus Blackallbacteria) CG13_big_fil_rev_8_21_14_2_50_49_14]